MAEETKQPNITEAQVQEAFGLYGYNPDAADLKYWSLRSQDDLRELYDNLKNRREQQNEAESQLQQAGTKDVLGDAFFRGDTALVKFSEDPDGPGPQSQSTIWIVEPKTKVLRPILSEDAFNNYFKDSLEETVNKGLIKTISMSYMNQGSPLAGFKLLTDEYGLKSDGTFKPVEVGVDLNKVSNKYGYKNDEELNRNTFKILNGFLSTVKNDQNVGISPTLIDNISNDKNVISMYVNALAYGGYQLNDIFRDIKLRDLVDKGQAQYSDMKAIDEGVRADQYYATPAGSAIRTNPDFSPPQYIGDVDSGLFDNPIFDIPADVYEVLVPPFDWRTPEGQAEIDKIKSAYHDVLLMQADATTERAKAIADYNYKLLQDEIEKKYGFALSDNANEAWRQIVGLGSTFATRGLAGTGLEREAMEGYLRDVRKADERQREAQLTEEEAQRRSQLMKYGSPEEIASLSDAEKEKYGFKPTQDVIDWFSTENLKSLYPGLSDQEIADYRASVLDDQGNYRSELYQKLAAQKLQTEQEKRTYQLGSVQTDPETGKVISGTGVLYKKALEEEKKYLPYTKAEDFEKPVTTPTKERVPIPETFKPEAERTPTWKAPAGYEKIAGPSQLPQYTNIVDEPGTIHKWGVKKTPQQTTSNAFSEWTKGKTDVLGKNWEGYKPISGAEYDTEDKRKQWQNVQSVGGTLYGYKK